VVCLHIFYMWGPQEGGKGTKKDLICMYRQTDRKTVVERMAVAVASVSRGVLADLCVRFDR
jgi:hypothetical protein